MTGLARCCKPAPPDPIVGFVTRGKGVSRSTALVQQRDAHARDAAGAAHRGELGRPRDEVFPVDIVVEAMDRQGLLRDISEVLSREKINVTAANTLTKKHALAHGLHDRGPKPRGSEGAPWARARRQGRAGRDASLTRIGDGPR
jgi:(p)ppGpp synthase/HD superfamily hydrolase